MVIHNPYAKLAISADDLPAGRDELKEGIVQLFEILRGRQMKSSYLYLMITELK